VRQIPWQRKTLVDAENIALDSRARVGWIESGGYGRHPPKRYHRDCYPGSLKPRRDDIDDSRGQGKNP